MEKDRICTTKIGTTKISGYAKTTFERQDQKTISDLVLQAVNDALNVAHCTHKDIDYVITASVDLWDGKTASNIAITEVVGAVLKGETRVASDSLMALIHADYVLATEKYKKVLVVAHCKESEIEDIRAVSSWTFDPLYMQNIGMDFTAASLLQHDILFNKSSVPELFTRNQFPDGAIAFVLERDSQKNKGPYLISYAHQMGAHYLGRRKWEQNIFSQVLEEVLKKAHLEDFSSLQWAALSGSTCWEEERYQIEMKKRNFKGEFVPFQGAPFIVKGLSRLSDILEKMKNCGLSRGLVHSSLGPAAQGECVCIIESIEEMEKCYGQ